MKNFPRELVHSSGAQMQLDTTKLLLSFKEAPDEKDLYQLLAACELQLCNEDNSNRKSTALHEVINHTANRFWVQQNGGKSFDDATYEKIEARAGGKLEWLGPVYKLTNDNGTPAFLTPIPNVLLVLPATSREKTDNKNTEEVIASFIKQKQYGLDEVTEKSKYLGGYKYFKLNNPAQFNAFSLRDELAKNLSAQISEIHYEYMPMIRPLCAVPNDTFFAKQWNMTQIHAPAAWDITTGSNMVVIAVIDTGVDLTHPDLRFFSTGVDLGDMVSDGSPNSTLAAFGNEEIGHGTCCAGIIAAIFNNAEGVTGLAGNCLIMPVALNNWTNAELASGINYAANKGAHIISMSLSFPADPMIDTAIQNAFNANLVLCAASGNNNILGVSYPASNANIIACGGSDQSDNRKTPSSSDGEGWGANYGAELSVTAPCVFIPSTDIQGTGGFNYDHGAARTDNTGAITWPDTGDNAGNYFTRFDGTSAATPHVAGLAALVRSQYPTLTNTQVRNVIELTAEKTGSLAYAATSGKANGTWNQEMGYGRINAVDAVVKGGWNITPNNLHLTFIDIPEGETQLRAIRIDVNSFHAVSFEMSALPTAPFSMYNYSNPTSLPDTTDYDTTRSVFLWVKYTGTHAGDTANGTAQAHCITTGAIYNVTISANTIARPTCVMELVLDKSGSMLDSSGVGTMTREQVLKYSAGILLSTVKENNAVGMVTFDQDAYDLLNPVAGPFGAPDDPFDTARTNATNALSLYAANPAGTTSIGDGIERAHNNLAPVTGYDKKAIIVFTDGFENTLKYIADVSSEIDNQVFAVGLGTAQDISPSALTNICNGHNGYVLLTDQLTSDDTFKLAKYFLQIQAGLNNEQIVVDPNGYILPGSIVKIPFHLNEADISVDAIVMLPVQGIVEVAIETPGGDIIEAANLLSFPTVKKVDAPQVTYYRMTLPVSNGAAINAQSGQWNILLKINEQYNPKYFANIRSNASLYGSTHGIKYTALVHAYSNLRMNCLLSQNSYEPGARIFLRSALTEYGIPLETNAKVAALLTMPGGTVQLVHFTQVATGVYEAQVDANYQGVYQFVIQASGYTSRNVPFTREQVLTAAVWKGGDSPVPSASNNPNKKPTEEIICKLIHCITKNISGAEKERLLKSGINIEGLLNCFCKNTGQCK